jgi:hypothetical protein
MFPILPSTGMQAEARHETHVPENEEEYAQKYGRVLHLPGSRVRARERARFILIAAAVIITLVLVAALV